MHDVKLPALPAGAGGAPALVFPVVQEKKIEINDRSEIGAAICTWQAQVGAGEKLRLRFCDGGTFVGSVTLTREDADDLAVKVEGRIFDGRGDDRGISLSFQCEPDGPIGLPLVARDCDGLVIGVYTDDDEDLVSAETVKAAFFASGATFTAANAPPIKPESHLGYAAESAKAGAALKSAASKAEAAWIVKLGREKGQKGGKGGEKWFRFQGRTLVQMAPSEQIEGRRMPKPAAPTPKPTTEKRAVHKRTRVGV